MVVAAAWLLLASPAQATFPGASMTNGVLAYESLDRPEIHLLLLDPVREVLGVGVGPSDRDPSWSADGRQLAFTSTRDGNEEIYLADADGGNQRRLTFDPGRDDDPSWSPDGTQIAFMSTRDGNPNIYVMGADGSNPHRVTGDAATDQQPAWSPDGLLIAFTSERDGNPEIYVMSPDGSGQKRLTDAPVGDADPSWSPDGQQIAFTEGVPGHAHLFAMSRDGTIARALTADPHDDHFPCWSPDGKQLAFTSDRDGAPGIYVLSADGIRGPVVHGTDASWAPLALPPPTIAPAAGQTANAATVAGDVLVRLPGTPAGQVLPLQEVSSIPTDSTVDTKAGVVGLSLGTSAGQPSVTNATAAGARFTLSLSSDGATLTLLGASARLRVRVNGSALPPAADARAARRRHRRKHRRRRRPHCARTATRQARVAGCATAWTTEVQPGGTLVTVTSDVVRVDDLVRGRSVLVAAHRRDLRGRRGVVRTYFVAG
jgi:dipeptidyl aminopeptidase/acylaminoacyl peptidase